MNMQAVVIRSILIVAMSLGVCVALLHRAYYAPELAAAAAAGRNVTASNAVTLPTVRVRPTVADIAAALESEDDFAAAAYIRDAAQFYPASMSSAPALPGLHLEMPYYSFGKTLPRVSKE